MAIQTRTTAMQNEVVRLYMDFWKDGLMADPSSQPVVQILDVDGVTILGQVPATKQGVGVWFVDWFVPKTLPTGNYYDRWRFQWTSDAEVAEKIPLFTVHKFDSYINFVSPAISTSMSDRVAQLINDLTNGVIYEAQHIPVYSEQVRRINSDSHKLRNRTFYYMELDADKYSASNGAKYTNNGQTYTVYENLTPYYSSSSTSSESVGNVSSSSSSSSENSSSSSSSSSQGSSSSSSQSQDESTSTSEGYFEYQPILTLVGFAPPSASGTLTKVSGSGNASITFTSYTSEKVSYSTYYDMAYKNWNKDPRPVVRLNNRIIEDGWYADFDGKIYFDRALDPEDTVDVGYNFKWFSDVELMNFLKQGLDMMNAIPPASDYYTSLNNMPPIWNAGVLLWAGILSLRRLIFALNYQEKRVVYGSPDDINGVSSRLENLYQHYFDLWEKTATNTKKRLPSTMMSVQPEYTLPGGRSRWFRYLYKANS